MKKHVSTAIFCVAAVVVVVIAVMTDRSGPSDSPNSIDLEPSKSGVSPSGTQKTIFANGKSSRRSHRSVRAVEKGAEGARGRMPTIEPGLDEASFSKWLDPRPPRTGDEMENIPEDEEEYPVRQLDAQARFREAVFSTLGDKTLQHAAFGRSLLSSQTTSLRSLGGVLLVETGAFSDSDAAALASDADAAVPLSVLEWIRERGTPEQLAALEAAFAARGLTSEDLLSVLTSLSSATGGAREALDKLIKWAPEDDLPDLLAAVASSESAAYDVRMQALMALRGVAPFSVAGNTMIELEKTAEPPEESLWGKSLDLYSDLVDLAAEDKAPYKVWDVLVRDLEFLSSVDYENNVRDMANYVENGVRGDDPVIQEGAWRIIDAYISEVNASGHAGDAAIAEPLARLARLNERLKPFDPEFAVPDPDPVPEADAGLDDETDAEEVEEDVREQEQNEPEPDEEEGEAAKFDSAGNPMGSGSSEVPVGVETVEPYRP